MEVSLYDVFRKGRLSVIEQLIERVQQEGLGTGLSWEGSPPPPPKKKVDRGGLDRGLGLAGGKSEVNGHSELSAIGRGDSGRGSRETGWYPSGREELVAVFVLCRRCTQGGRSGFRVRDCDALRCWGAVAAAVGVESCLGSRDIWRLLARFV